MKYFAKIENNIVTNIVVSDYQIDGSYIEYKKDGSLRKNEPIIGSTYNPDKDIFILPKPYDSWVLNENDNWESPIGAKPIQEGFIYSWNEESGAWDEFEKVNVDL